MINTVKSFRNYRKTWIALRNIKLDKQTGEHCWYLVCVSDKQRVRDTETHNTVHSRLVCWVRHWRALSQLAARRGVAWHRASCSVIGQYASAELAWSSPHFLDLSYEYRCSDFQPYRRKRKYSATINGTRNWHTLRFFNCRLPTAKL